MGIELFFFAVLLLAAFAAFDLVVGVSNDAVNFLNSAIGAKVAPRYVILAIATLGILAGVTFSSGMMEVARKGIFHPAYFNMPELIAIFLAVMLTDIILLDVFNTFGLPTSTTVSIVFELLGAAVAVATMKVLDLGNDLSTVVDYINTSQALFIIGGILLSVAVSFVCGAIAQTLTRLLFTFDYAKRMKRYGALWGGVALSSVTYFILVKGAKGTSFLTSDTKEWIASNAVTILLVSFAVSAVVLQVLIIFRMNILKPIILVGTFALALAFAANDLVNFIGVPMAGYHAYETAAASASPLDVPMDALGKAVPTNNYLLLLAGLIMVATLWLSKKARTVSETELSLGQQEEGNERFESTRLARLIVRMSIGLLDTVKCVIPAPIRAALDKRLDTSHYEARVDEDDRPSFDLMRASVNIMVASAVISYGTSYKLPLSTTYVTFMVSMGTSFADRAWGRESAVYRVTGVLMVIGGWFVTAITAFSVSFVFATVIFFGGEYGVAGLLGVVGLVIWQSHRRHQQRTTRSQKEGIFNLKKITSVSEALPTTFEQVAYFLSELRESLDISIEALFAQNEYVLNAQRTGSKKIQRYANIIVANVFKTMRLLQRKDAQLTYKYGRTVRRLQKLADGHRDIVLRAHVHVSNQHKGLLDAQIEELGQVRRLLDEILIDVESTFNHKLAADFSSVVEKDRMLRELVQELQQVQMERVRDGASKTRLSILFYAVLGNAAMISKQCLKLLETFSESFGGVETSRVVDPE